MVHPQDIFSLSEPWTVRIKKIAQEFVKKGHKVKLVYFPLGNKDLVDKILRGVETIPFCRKKWAVFKNIKKMKELGKWADVIHFQKCFHYAALPALFASYFSNKPIHYDWDDWEYKIYESGCPSKLIGYYLDLLERTIPKLADTTSVASSHLKKLALSLEVSNERIVYAHVGADLELFNPQVDGSSIRDRYGISKHLVLYQGQLHGSQYAELFINSAELILKSNENITFMVVGGGYDLNRLMNLVKSKGIVDKVIFTGFVEHEEVPLYIAASDVVVACFEDNEITRCKSPLKIAEYMASGKAIVASDVGEVKNMAGEACLLTKPGDANSLAKGILTLLKNKNLRRSMGKQARKRAEKLYNWHVTSDNLLKAYSIALKQNG